MEVNDLDSAGTGNGSNRSLRIRFFLGWLTYDLCRLTIVFSVLFFSCLACTWAESSDNEDPPSVLEQIDAYIAGQEEQGRIDRGQDGWRSSLPPFPVVDYTGSTELRVVVETEKGTSVIRLHPSSAPRHVANLFYLCRLGFYDGMSFQMLQPGKRVMWGCPIGNGQGTPGYTFHREENQGIALDKAGYLCQASTGKDGDGCVLFVTVGPMPWMKGKTTVLGVVEEGPDVWEELARSGGNDEIERKNLIIKRIKVDESTVEPRDVADGVERYIE